MKRILCLLALLALLSGCHRKEPLPTEHAAGAAMAHVPEFTLYLPDGAGGLTAQVKRLPMEVQMADAVLALFPETVLSSACCTVAGADATADLTGFVRQPSPALERAALASVVNTLLALPEIERVSLTFDGERVLVLPQGTEAGEVFTRPIETAADAVA